ncbi:hypothetical protein [Flavobacterium sp. GP15]|nr:hypothetical protein [Flavobacterium sp. GP15]
MKKIIQHNVDAPKKGIKMEFVANAIYNIQGIILHVILLLI